jgi:hypothetical protein
MATIANAPLRTFLETMDADTVAFVTFCLEEMTQIKGTQQFQWFCASKRKAMALAQSLVHLGNTKIAIKKVDPMNEQVDPKYHLGDPMYQLTMTVSAN